MTNAVCQAYPGTWEPAEWRMAVWGQVGDPEMRRISNCFSAPLASPELPQDPKLSPSYLPTVDTTAWSASVIPAQEQRVGAHREVGGGEWRAFAKIVYASDQVACTQHSGLIRDSGLRMGTLPTQAYQESAFASAPTLALYT